ncbi:MAG: hypothetical protein EP343_18550 [Deltaproteobacteria bacterium]|nr:MAG: hypothetical protein EP343_18550 [Deltaproteobacteria bacterium]
MRTTTYRIGFGLVILFAAWFGLIAPGCGELPTSNEAPVTTEPNQGKEATQDTQAESPTQELAQETTTEPPPETGLERSAEESLPVEPVEEPSPQDAGPTERTEPSQGEEATPEATPETTPELQPEGNPEAGPVTQAKAVSLLASFLKDNPQSGLMNRGKTAGQWLLSVVVPAGQHTLRLRLHSPNQDLDIGPASTGTWPYQGKIVPKGTAFALSLQRAARFAVTVELGTQQVSLVKEPEPSAVEVVGDWSGKKNQQATLQRQNDGSFQVALMLTKGVMTWNLKLQLGGSSQTYGVRYPARGILPQGGVIEAGGQANAADISQDGTYQLTYRPLERTFVLRPQPLDGFQAFQTLLKDIAPISSSTGRIARIDQFLNRMKVASQLPYVSGQKVLFVVRWKQAKAPVHVSGSFNQWSTSKDPMKQVPGTDFYYAELTLPVGRHAYKFVDSSSTLQWQVDPNNEAFVFGGFGPDSIVSTEGSKDGELRQHPDFFATQLNNRRTLYVYLPPEYYKNLKWRYPVVYMHDGQNLFDPKAMWGGWGVDKWVNQLAAAGKIQPAIVVGVANTSGRFAEYTHTQDKIQGQTVGGKAKDYADFLLREVKPWIDGRYRTQPTRRQTSVMGSSLGGLISLWLGYEYPDVFFRIGALSSTFGWGQIGASNPTLLDIVKKESPRDIVIYIDSGSPADNSKETTQMRDLLQSKGYVFGLNLQHWLEQGAQHNEKAWNDRLFRPLQFLLSWP